MLLLAQPQPAGGIEAGMTRGQPRGGLCVVAAAAACVSVGVGGGCEGVWGTRCFAILCFAAS